MLQPPFFRRKNFGLASLWVCQANFFMQQREIKKGGCHAEARECGSGQTTVTQYMRQMQNTAMLMPTSHFHYVYILRDVATGKRHYTGVTHDLQERLAMHNAGHVPHTSKFAPWYIETAIAFRDKEKAFAYERYLKTGAGRAYAIKHF